MFAATEATQDEFEINPGGGDVDFIVQASGIANALFVEGSTGNVGVGTNPLGQALTVYRSAANAGIEVISASAGSGFLTLQTGANTAGRQAFNLDSGSDQFQLRLI